MKHVAKIKLIFFSVLRSTVTKGKAVILEHTAAAARSAYWAVTLPAQAQ